ncbi:hypothetical protein [Streptomyces sp. I8-5]
MVIPASAWTPSVEAVKAA